MAGGRPTKLTDTLREEICKLVRLGLTHDRAARAAGISVSTFQNWRKRGEGASKGVYKQFLDALEDAEVNAERLHLHNLEELALGGRRITERKTLTRADGSVERTITTKVLAPSAEESKWILARRFPERWGNQRDVSDERDVVVHIVSDKAPIDDV